MIVIRPLLRANAARTRNVHVVIFFIILVANVGGALTPLGDPPLFVGFLHGVTFFWPVQHLWTQAKQVVQCSGRDRTDQVRGEGCRRATLARRMANSRG